MNCKSSTELACDVIEIYGQKTVFIFDKDLTLVDSTQPHAPNHPSEQILMLNVKEVLSLLKKNRKKMVIVTNQGGIEIGKISENEVISLIQDVSNKTDGAIDVVESTFCPHLKVQCDCRKPKPGMIFQVIESLRVQKEEVIFIGDDEKDRSAAISAGVDFVLAKNFFHRDK